MKNIKYTIIILVALCSCSKYLDEMPQNKLKPSTTSDYEQLLNRGYITKQVMPFLDIASDDVYLKASDHVMPIADMGDFAVGAYMWDNTHESTLSAGDEAFSALYESIYYANVVLQNIDNAKGVELNEDNIVKTKNNIKGEAFALRAYSYFYLVNLYGAPYSTETAKTDAGVPIILDTDAENKAYPRSTVQEVYNLMISDLTQGIKLMEDNPVDSKGKFKFNSVSASLLLSRVYLYAQMYEEAAKIAESVIKSNPILFNLYEAGEILNIKNNTGTSWGMNSIWGKDYLDKTNDNVLFVNGINEIIPIMSYWPFSTTFSVNPELASIYEENDVRRFYFMHTYKRATYAGDRIKLTYAKNRYISLGYMFSVSPGSGYTRVLRVEEAYLIAAESYAQLGNFDDAIQKLNTLRKEKFRRGQYNSLSSSDFNKQTLVNFILLERRKEFCFEGQRWFDLRRTTRPAMTRPGYDGKIASIKQNDPRYTFQVPQAELDINPSIGAWPR